MMELIFATGNAAKLEHMRKMLSTLPITLVGLRELDFSMPEVDKNGNDPLENARIKAMAYYRVIWEKTGLNIPVFSCDSGLHIKGAPESIQPGVYVRNVGGKRLNDDEMIEHYANIAKQMCGKATARYKNAICLVVSENEIYEHTGDDIAGNEFIMASEPHPKRVEGFPLDSLAVQVVSGKYYYDLKEDKYESETYWGFAEFFRRVLQIE